MNGDDDDDDNCVCRMIKKKRKKKRMFRMQAKNYDIIYITINSRLYNVEDLSVLTRGYLSSVLLQSRLVYRRINLRI